MKKSAQKGLFDDEGDPVGDLKEIQKQWQVLVKPLQAVAGIKPDRPEATEHLEKAIAKLPASEDFLKSLNELRRVTDSALRNHRKTRQDAFRRAEVDLIRELKQSNRPIREGDASWRVGSVELQVRREQAQAKIFYNREPLIDWTTATSRQELSGLLDKGTKLLNASAIPERLLVSAAWGAYQALSARSTKKGASRAARVAIREFYREFRVALTRSELAGGRPDKKLKYAELPQWAFLYNLDLYRKLPAAAKKDRNISFETGSQKEQSSGMGLVLNGLDPLQDYKVFCFAVSVRG